MTPGPGSATRLPFGGASLAAASPFTAAGTLAAASLFIALALLVAPAPPLAAQTPFDEPEARFSFAGVEFPSVVDTFAVMRVTRWPDARLGVGLSYASPMAADGNFDVYVYPTSSPREGIEASKLVEQEFETALDDVRRYAERGRGVELTMEGQDTVEVATPEGREHRGRRAEVTFRRGSGARRSLLYVFEKDGWFVKYRFTYDPDQHEALRPRIEAFVAGTLAGVGPGRE